MKKILLLILVTILLISCNNNGCLTKVQNVDYKVGILGAPSFPNVEWNEENLLLMKNLGFNAMQLNIAWGYRPAGEPLNLEDVLPVPDKFKLDIDIDSTLNKNVGSYKTFIHAPGEVASRAKKLKERSALCKKHGMRSIFHFGAPYVQYPAIEPLSQCILDTFTIERYVTLIENFHTEFPDVDDLLLYTYDQNAWLCSEFGPCPRCNGVPLDQRVAKFVNTLAQTWNRLNEDGRLWWEPWEISGGQTYKIMPMLDNDCVGLSLHSSITEVQIALPADRWFRNMLTLAEENDIPVLGELWLGSATEEVEPYIYLPSPLTTLRALRAVNSAGKLKGIKEYYGNIPNREDVNLNMTSIFFSNPGISDDEALNKLSQPYGEAAEKVALYWKYASEAIELYPWDISWNSREVGKINPLHSMAAATLKGVIWETPSWQSNRRANLMRTSDTENPHFWMLEDAQLRYEATALRIDKALEVAFSIQNKIPEEFTYEFTKGMEELEGFKKSLNSYVYHIRETNLCYIMRDNLAQNKEIKAENIEELRHLLQIDQKNQGTSSLIGPAIKMFNEDFNKFLNTYFLEKDYYNKADRVCIGCPNGIEEEYIQQDAIWSVTSY